MTKIARQTQSCWRYKDDGSFSCKEVMLVIAENETRAHGVGISRGLYLYPLPLEGENWGRLCKPIILKSKRLAFSQPFDFERKTRLELATPTLARLCSTN